MKEKGYLTVGEMLYKDEKFKQVKRNKGEDYSNTFLRSQIEDEVNIIFEKQKEFGNVLITDILIEKYKDILFSQRQKKYERQSIKYMTPKYQLYFDSNSNHT